MIDGGSDIILLFVETVSPALFVEEVVSPPIYVFVTFIGSYMVIVGCVDFWVLYLWAHLSVGPALFYIALKAHNNIICAGFGAVVF